MGWHTICVVCAFWAVVGDLFALHRITFFGCCVLTTHHVTNATQQRRHTCSAVCACFVVVVSCLCVQCCDVGAMLCACAYVACYV